MLSRRNVLSAVAALLVASAGASVFAQVTAQRLFFIQRSKNANEVHYEAHVRGDGTLDPKNPVEGFWLNKAEDGSRSGISLLQRIAYGFDIDAQPDGTHAMKLKALPERALTLIRVDGKWRARTTIAGQQAYLNRLYVTTDESGVFPKVLFVDVFGEDLSGKPVQERLKK